MDELHFLINHSNSIICKIVTQVWDIKVCKEPWWEQEFRDA